MSAFSVVLFKMKNCIYDSIQRVRLTGSLLILCLFLLSGPESFLLLSEDMSKDDKQ